MAEDKDIDALEGSLDVYKTKVAQVNKATLTWDKELIFVGRTQRGCGAAMGVLADRNASALRCRMHGHRHGLISEKDEVRDQDLQDGHHGGAESHAAPILYFHDHGHLGDRIRPYGEKARARHIPVS
jgi:hypothetical protein